MTAVATSSTNLSIQPTLALRASPLRRTETYIFGSPENAKRTIPDAALTQVIVDSLLSSYYVCHTPPPPTIPPPLPPPPPAKAVSQLPSPSPRPPIKSATPESALKPTENITTERDVSSISVDKPTPEPLTQTQTSTDTLNNQTTTVASSSTKSPKYYPITISYDSYRLRTLANFSNFSNQVMIVIPLGHRINYRGRFIVLTKEFLATLNKIEGPSRPVRESVKEGIYVLSSQCVWGPPDPLPEWAERMRMSVGTDPIHVDISREIREKDEKINENERAITVQACADLVVVLSGTMKVVRIEALSAVDLGYSKLTRKRFLEGLKVRGVKRKWDDAQGECGEIEVVRCLEEENVDGERKRKRVKYWAGGIDENQVAKGPMKSRKMIEWEKMFAEKKNVSEGKEAEKKEEGRQGI